MDKIIAQGAEAVLILKTNIITKKRIKKNYRLPELDRKIRLFRTKREAKIMNKVYDLINVPKILDVSEKKFSIDMDFVEGIPLVQVLDSLSHYDREMVCKKIGEGIGIMHNNNIVHGDLTTSNILLKGGDVYFIDFGLSFVSLKPEDKAVDLHLVRQGLNSKHYQHCKKSFENVLDGYRKKCKDSKLILNRLEKVQSRGRYKRKV